MKKCGRDGKAIRVNELSLDAREWLVAIFDTKAGERHE